jgi:C4-dicarboxylate-specific signal transduction histidine kinase
LRLNRAFGPDRVGWSLFSAFSLLALLHLAQSLTFFKSEEHSTTTMQATYALISLLMLTGMAHIEALFKERLRLEQEETRLRAGLELEVEKKTRHLTRAIEALQAEIDERKRMEAEVAAHIELLETSHFRRSPERNAGTQVPSNILF